MKKHSLVLCGALLTTLFVGLASSKLTFNDNSYEPAKAAEAETGLELIALGDAISFLDSPWNENGGIDLTETSPGIYSVVLYCGKNGQIIITERGSWSEHRYLYTDVDSESISSMGGLMEDYNTHNGGSGDHNIYLTGSWGYYKFTVDTSKNDHKLSVEAPYLAAAPTIAGPGVKDGQWNCSSVDYVFDTTDGITFTKLVKTVANESWRIVGLNTGWSTWANWTNLDVDSPCYGDFGDGGGNDRNLKSLQSKYYLVTFNSRAEDGKKLYIEYYEKTIYFSLGTTWNDWGDVDVYAWTSSDTDAVAAWPGMAMEYLGGNIYTYTYVGVEDPAGMKFSKHGDNNNPVKQTGNVVFPEGKNLYVYEADSYIALSESMIIAESFAEQFLNDTATACENKNVTSGVWETTQTHAAALLADDGAKALALSGEGLYLGLSLSNDPLVLALERYDTIIGKYHHTDYLHRFDSGSGILNHGMIANLDSNTMLVIVSVSAATLVALASFFLLRKKKESK